MVGKPLSSTLNKTGPPGLRHGFGRTLTWVPVRPVVLREDASDEQQAIELIAEHGFCCFD